MGDGIRRFGDAYSPAIPISEDARGRFVLFTDHEAALAAAVEERDRRIEERGLVEGRQEPPAVTTGLEMNTNPEGDENLD